MSDSREESPDWLRSFVPPSQSAIELSSGSESPSDHSPVSDDEDVVKLSKLFKKEVSHTCDTNESDDVRDCVVVDKPVKGKSPRKDRRAQKRKNEDEGKREAKRAKGEESNGGSALDKHGKLHEQNHSSQEIRPAKEVKGIQKELSPTNEEGAEDNQDIDVSHLNYDRMSPENKASKAQYPPKMLAIEKEKTSKKNLSSSINGGNETNNNLVKEEIPGKNPGHQVSSSRVPLLLSEKVQRSKALVECEGESIDLSGDVGSVGRIVVSDDPHEMLLDLKGTIYKTTIVPSRTFCVVSFGQSEAKIEAIMNDYIQLKPVSNVYEAETMVEGTLDGFSFDSEDEADKTAAQNEAVEEQLDGKTKKADKTSGLTRKKGKPAGGKPSKKVKKKPQIPKKSKTKK